jgi:uncharacterized membrane protein
MPPAHEAALVGDGAAASPLAPLTLAQQAAVFFLSLLSFVILDGVWIGFVAKDFYAAHLASAGVLRPDVDVLAAALSWFAIVGAVFMFVLPSTAGDRRASRSLMLGAKLGVCLYATVDFTNAALIRGWGWPVALVDCAWGTTACAVCALVQNRLYAAFAEMSAR